MEERSTSPAQAIAGIGRIDKIIHRLNFINDEARRRGTLPQLNRGECRPTIERDVFDGKRDEVFQRYREGQEDPSSVFDRVVNVIEAAAARLWKVSQCLTGLNFSAL